MDPAFDLIVIGAGPAGLAGAITARALRLQVAVLEALPEPGGQLLPNDTPILDCPGLDAPTGSDLARQLLRHLERLGGAVRRRAEVRRLDVAAGEVVVGDERLAGAALLLATGAARRRLGIPGEADVPGRGLSPAARRFGPRFAGRPIVVVGGGDVALEEAALLAQVCPRVLLVHRGAALRGRPDFRAAALAEPRIEVHLQTRLVALRGQPEVRAAVLVGPGGEREVEVAGAVVCAGLAPRSELVVGQVERDEAGCVRVDARQRTSASRLYAAGDVCAGSSWMVATALGQAATAVKDIERRLSRGELTARLTPGSPFAPSPWSRGG